MIRTLSIVLDSELNKGPFRSKTLLEMEADKLDDFIIENFEDSEQIRERYQKEIAAFLEENKANVDAISERTGIKFRGRIIIYEWEVRDNSVYFSEKRILYKKNIVAFETMLHDKKTLLGVLELEIKKPKKKHLLSDYIHDRLRLCDVKYKSHIDEIRRYMKKTRSNFYDCIRLLSKAYEEQRKVRKDLKTIEAIYKESLQNSPTPQPMPLPKSQSSKYLEEDETFVWINGVKYPKEEAMLLGITETEQDVLPEIEKEDIGEELRPKLVKRKPIEEISVDDKDYIIVKDKGLEQMRFDDRSLIRRK